MRRFRHFFSIAIVISIFCVCFPVRAVAPPNLVTRIPRHPDSSDFFASRGVERDCESRQVPTKHDPQAKYAESSQPSTKYHVRGSRCFARFGHWRAVGKFPSSAARRLISLPLRAFPLASATFPSHRQSSGRRRPVQTRDCGRAVEESKLARDAS